jgi:hypothetical protein
MVFLALFQEPNAGLERARMAKEANIIVTVVTLVAGFRAGAGLVVEGQAG